MLELWLWRKWTAILKEAGLLARMFLVLDPFCVYRCSCLHVIILSSMLMIGFILTKLWSKCNERGFCYMQCCSYQKSNHLHWNRRTYEQLWGFWCKKLRNSTSRLVNPQRTYAFLIPHPKSLLNFILSMIMFLIYFGFVLKKYRSF